MLIFIIGIVSIVSIVIIVAVKCHYNTPQSKCNHELETIKTRTGTYSIEYLSTCKKCGFQRKHEFSGIN